MWETNSSWTGRSHVPFTLGRFEAKRAHRRTAVMTWSPADRSKRFSPIADTAPGGNSTGRRVAGSPMPVSGDRWLPRARALAPRTAIPCSCSRALSRLLPTELRSDPDTEPGAGGTSEGWRTRFPHHAGQSGFFDRWRLRARMLPTLCGRIAWQVGCFSPLLFPAGHRDPIRGTLSPCMGLRLGARTSPSGSWERGAAGLRRKEPATRGAARRIAPRSWNVTTIMAAD